MNVIKTTIKDVLKESGDLKATKLRKKVLKTLEEEYGDKEKEFDRKYEVELNSLVCKNKISEKDGVYSAGGGSAKVDNQVLKAPKQIEQQAPAKVEKVERKRKDTTEIQGKKKHVKMDENTGETIAEGEKGDMTQLWQDGEKHWKNGTFDSSYLAKNPDRITRIFVGNLNRKITEDDLKGCIEGITHIKWITDKESGEFYGSTFIEMKDALSATTAVSKDKQKFMGRPLKVFYCPPRPGDVWPPKDGGRGGPGGGKGGAEGSNGPPRRERTAKTAGCKKVFAGNLSYNIDDDVMIEFFKDCGEVVGLRWICHKETNEFRGVGFVEFGTSEEADKAILLDGKELLGRNIRLDWTD